MTSQSFFEKLVKEGQPTGEVVGVNRFLVTVNGLNKVRVGSLVLFEDGTNGYVYLIQNDQVLVINLDSENIEIGQFVVVKSLSLTVEVGLKTIGRIISPMGYPVDGKGLISKTISQPIFAPAPKFYERSILDAQLETSVAVVDTLFPVLYGQRISVMGDSKSGKTTFASQVMINQAKQGKLVVYGLIGKRKTEIEQIIELVNKHKINDRVIFVLANVFDSLPMTYLAPYAACAVAEYFWQNHEDVIVIYDDLSSHAKAYRELSLLVRQSPGRESYPGDMFHAHSTLLERAGKLARNNLTLTSLPLICTPNDDITSYLATNLISITDGQIIFDLETKHSGILPAVNVGLSVSRIGGRGQTNLGRLIGTQTLKQLALYRKTKEMTRFVNTQVDISQSIIEMGEQIYEIFNQGPEELLSLNEQAIILMAILNQKERVNIKNLKEKAKKYARQRLDDKEIAKLSADLSEAANN